MLTEEIICTLSHIDPVYKTVSVKLYIIVKKDGVEIARNHQQCSFAPGQINAVKDYIGMSDCPEIVYLQSIWTQDVIDAYNASQSEQQP